MRTPEEEMDDMVLTLRQMRYEYYRYSDPVTSDYFYDKLERYLVLLETERPDLRKDNSPTITVGSDMLDEELEPLRTAFREKWKNGHQYQRPEIQ